jgi:hypothetical protein
MAEEIHRIQLEVPKSWLPKLEEIARVERRSRHAQILRFIELGIQYHEVLKNSAVVEEGRRIARGESS